jgi:hypothetical protein
MPTRSPAGSALARHARSRRGTSIFFHFAPFWIHCSIFLIYLFSPDSSFQTFTSTSTAMSNNDVNLYVVLACLIVAEMFPLAQFQQWLLHHHRPRASRRRRAGCPPALRRPDGDNTRVDEGSAVITPHTATCMLFLYKTIPMTANDACRLRPGDQLGTPVPGAVPVRLVRVQGGVLRTLGSPCCGSPCLTVSQGLETRRSHHGLSL